MMPMKKLIGSVILVLGIGGGLWFFNERPTGKVVEVLPPLPAETVLTKKQIEEDRNKAIQFVEDVHSYFIDYECLP